MSTSTQSKTDSEEVAQILVHLNFWYLNEVSNHLWVTIPICDYIIVTFFLKMEAEFLLLKLHIMTKNNFEGF